MKRNELRDGTIIHIVTARRAGRWTSDNLFKRVLASNRPVSERELAENEPGRADRTDILY
jgi:hypothetical protein